MVKTIVGNSKAITWMPMKEYIIQKAYREIWDEKNLGKLMWNTGEKADPVTKKELDERVEQYTKYYAEHEDTN